MEEFDIIVENEEPIDISAELENDFLRGEKGEKGDSNTLTIGTVTKGEEASASITGESPNQKLNLVLPKGDKGDKGEQGIQGQNGQDGYTPVKGTDYFTEEEIQQIESNVLDKVNQFSVQVVQELPTENIDDHTIYFVLKTNTEQNDVYDEYIYVNNDWEHIGTTAVDLSNYYNKEEVDNKVDNIQALPTGGTTGQVLTKQSDTDGDASWEDSIATVNLVENSYKLTLTEEVAGGGIITVSSSYKVGADRLDVYLNGEKLIKATSSDTEGHYYEVGTEGTLSNTIQITSDWSASVGDVFEFTIRTNGQGVAEENLDIYSTEETVIGKWIDGKPLYRKVLKALDITTVQGTNRKDWDLTSLHISEIINPIGFVQFWQPSMNAYQRLDVNGWSNTQEDFHQSFEMTSAEVSIKTKVNFYLILEYTKTTDTGEV